MNIFIRTEETADILAIHEITVAAFLNAPHAGHTEQFIVTALRDSGALTISLVAEISNKVVGHVAVSPVTISDGSTDWYGLGPISVRPDHQGDGIGSKLMYAALAALKTLKANGCVLLGDPNYYHRFGFMSIEGLTYSDVPLAYFQAHLLQGTYPQGEVNYHESFSALS